MRQPIAEDFPIQAGITPLNHASYGISTRRTLELACRLREEIESDPNKKLGVALQDQLASATRSSAGWLGLGRGAMALVNNATSGAAAIVESVPLAHDSVVAVLSTEYSSVARAWEVRAQRAHAKFVLVNLPLPVRATPDILAQLRSQVNDRIDFLQVSLVSSSAALRLPIAEIAEWTRDRGGALIVDAAHGPGHVDVSTLAIHADAAFGTLHKWLPVPRPVGFVWASAGFMWEIRPAEVSLSWDAVDFVERFGWPGTFDPVPRLCVADAIAQWESWRGDGMLSSAATLADEASTELSALGAIPTGHSESLAPRLRSFILPRVPLPEIKTAVDDARVRVWTGLDPNGATLLRFSTHVYSDHRDLERLLEIVRPLVRRRGRAVD